MMDKRIMLDNIVIAIPALNEEKNIVKVITDIKNLYPDVDILIIDDGSTDNTAKAAKEHGADVISHPFNLGIGSSRNTGFRYALKNGYDYLIQMDGDGQHDPQSIKDLALEKDNYDLINGSRFLDKSYKMQFFRNIGRKILHGLFSTLLKTPISDPTSGYRILNKKAMLFLVKHDFYDYPEIDSIQALLKAKYKVGEVPAKMVARYSGKSSIDFFEAFYFTFRVIISFLIMLFQKEKKYDV